MLYFVQSLFQKATRKSPARTRTAHRTRLCLEALEGRCVPAVSISQGPAVLIQGTALADHVKISKDGHTPPPMLDDEVITRATTAGVTVSRRFQMYNPKPFSTPPQAGSGPVNKPITGQGVIPGITPPN